MSGFKYQAFISYAHRDVAFARRLHRDLERFRLHKTIAFEATEGARAGSLGRFFRDDDELAASPDLGESIKTALAQSRSLIVVCSPDSAKSRWVSEEIRYFRDTLGNARIFAIILRGEPHASEGGAFSPSLLERGAEPLAADFRDVRAEARRDALSRLVAGLCGASHDAIKRRELARARASAFRNGLLALVGLGLAGVATAASVLAVQNSARLTVALGDRDSQFQSVNENAIAFAQTLTNWPPPAAPLAESIVGGLNPGGHDAQSSVGNAYWDRCPRRLVDCFVNRSFSHGRIDQPVVALVGAPWTTGPSPREIVIDAAARARVLQLCPYFVAGADEPIIRVCGGVAEFDPNLEGYRGGGALRVGLNEARGFAVSTVESAGYCGSGGCFFFSTLWLRHSDGVYRPAGAFDNDEFAVLLTADGKVAEVVASSRGQSGISSQFATVDRYRVSADGRLSRLLSFFFLEEYSAAVFESDAPPSLRVMPCLIGIARQNDYECPETE